VAALVLLSPLQEVWQLLQEFQALISSYIMKYSPPDAAEWRSVIQEVRTGAACKQHVHVNSACKDTKASQPDTARHSTEQRSAAQSVSNCLLACNHKPSSRQSTHVAGASAVVGAGLHSPPEHLHVGLCARIAAAAAAAVQCVWPAGSCMWQYSLLHESDSAGPAAIPEVILLA
jgi:hypothetical protein